MGRKRKGDPVSGWVVVDKPTDTGSTPAVNQVRRFYNAQKAGHAGTLDPFASGILPIALGEATKTMPYVTDSTKAYEFTVAWGKQTDTLDNEGDVVETSDRRPSNAEIEAALPEFTGLIDQIPPKFSAIKIDGERAYDMARRGEDPDMQSRTVEVLDLTLVDRPDPDHAVFAMSCGKGTYVRALGRDLATALGTVGHLCQLRRTRVGPFDLTDAHPLSDFSLEAADESAHKAARERSLLPLQASLDGIPAIALSDMEAMRLRNGQAVSLLRKLDLERVRDIEQGDTALAMAADKALALVRFEKGELHPMRVFNL